MKDYSDQELNDLCQQLPTLKALDDSFERIQSQIERVEPEVFSNQNSLPHLIFFSFLLLFGLGFVFSEFVFNWSITLELINFFLPEPGSAFRQVIFVFMAIGLTLSSILFPILHMDEQRSSANKQVSLS